MFSPHFPFKIKPFLRYLLLYQMRNTSTYYDIFPKSTKKVFLPNPKKPPKFIKTKTIPYSPTFEQVTTELRTNKLDIQMLSKNLYEQIFPTRSTEKIDPITLEQCKKALIQHKMITKPEDYTPDVKFKLPPLEGRNIEEHFHNIGTQQLQPYRQLVENLLKSIPTPPKKWQMQKGWTRYAPGVEPELVPFPREKALVFDVEVAMMAGKAPTLATAVSSEAWYGWVSQTLIDGTSKPITTHQYNENCLIPLESEENAPNFELNEFMKQPKIVIGHNVSYDRARIKEQYWLNRTGTRFLDTMSMHVCVSGLTSYQRATLKSGKENNDDQDDSWKQLSSLNSLDEVHKLYCGEKISKATRSLFVEGTLKEIKKDFQKLMQYCCNDVQATYNVLKVLYPLFMQRFPHPVTLAGMLELSTAYLPINNNWNRYIDNAEQAYEDLDIEGKMLLARRADQACHLMHDEKYKEDLWMWDEDWEVKELKVLKTPKTNDEDNEEDKLATIKGEEDEELEKLGEKFQYLKKTKLYLSKVNSHLPGYPNWYRKLCTKPDSSDNWVPGPHLISTSMQITPKLLSLTWEGYPLHYLRSHGWGFVVPFTDDLATQRKFPLAQLLKKCPIVSQKPREGRVNDALSDITGMVEQNLMRKEYYSKVRKDKSEGRYQGTGIWCNVEIDDCCLFFKLPHKNGAAYNVGNPLAKDFLNKFSENVLAGDAESAELVLTIARNLGYWRNNRDRIFDQMVVWLDSDQFPSNWQSYNFGAIVPQVMVSGTLTRRAVERTWMTASNAHPERVGSELRGMVQAPPGYNFVGADVDSQELWIASVIGDAQFAKMHGATPFGWMTLSGTKANATDMHSVTAKAVGISRDHAKVINYARIYGAGQNFAERLLKQFNPSISDGEARSKAVKMFNLTKGKKIFYLKKEFVTEDFPDKPYSKWQAFEMAKAHGKHVEDMFLKPNWVGGTESAMFNRLEAIANDWEPKTPFLKCRLSRALEPKSLSDRYLPTRVNWVVQSGAVDFLHLMLVCMRWIMGDKARFSLSFHDEIRYIVPEEYKYHAALAMHVTNLLTRCFCSARLGINDLPQSVAFFSSVEIDKVLRKESKLDCKTPSNPHGLEHGYGIPNGESLDIFEAVKNAAGQYPSWYQQLKS